MSIESQYQERAQRFQLEEEGWSGRDRWLAHLRVLAFLAAAAFAGVAGLSDGGWLWTTAAGTAFTGFLCLVAFHEYVTRQVVTCRELRRINEHAVSRLRRSWHEFPHTSVTLAEQDLGLSHDLDLFGRASLFHLLCTAGTSIGRQTVCDWLLRPPDVEVIRKRQEAVAELAGHLELREQLQLHGRLLIEGSAGPTRFIEWAEGEPWLNSRSWLLWTVRMLPLALFAVLLLTIAGVVSPDVGGLTITALVLVNAAVSVLFTGTVHDIFKVVSTRNGEVGRYREMFAMLYSMPETTSQLAEIKQELTTRGGGVLVRLSRLQHIMLLANISHSALTFCLFYLPLQLFALWDFQVLWLLEGWQARCGQHAKAWFTALGQFEALASLATLAHDNPQWAFPEVDAATDRIRATAIGHPLLGAESRVENDVEVGPAGSFLLVTGSNMSGKSTLLRSLGTNIVLAQAGAPVCAKRLSLPPLAVATSMRVRDSLQDGVSFFMAELRRLKEIVDQAQAFAERDERRLLFLLDEILQGTNSKERHVAVVRVLSHLLDCGAIGAVSTHDLELANSSPLDHSCHAVHFRETLHGQGAAQPMTFDYRLHEGVAKTTNALKLLELVGLGVARVSSLKK